MKLHTWMFAGLAAVSAVAIAAGPASSPRPVPLKEMVKHIETTYRGEVTAIELDTAGDKAPHYHVDILYPQIGVARLDVDAVTRELSMHEDGALPAGAASLPEIATLVGNYVPGHIKLAKLDMGSGTAPHYDVDVQLDGGQIARLKIDAASRAFGWREPPIGQ